MSELRVTLVQLAAAADRDRNLDVLADMLARAQREEPDLVVLPEACSYRGPFAPELVEGDDGPTLTLVREYARRAGVAVLIGGGWRAAGAGVRNASVFVGPSGDIVARYDKTHLFRLSASTLVEDEATHTDPGDQLVAVRYRGFQLGLTICFDVRFPELYRALARQGCDTLLVPANFAALTGRDHWLPLLRARAIENGCYVLAPAQIGPDGSGFDAYGRALAVDPWGVVLRCLTDEVGVGTVTLERSRLLAVRAALDMSSAQRPDLYTQRLELFEA